MKCPHCGAEDTKVINSRPANGGDTIRRRRECEACEERFTTFETVERLSQTVIKRDGSREPYDRKQLLKSLDIACNKTPLTASERVRIVDTIEADVFRGPSGEARSSEIGDHVLRHLRAADPVAYVRYASVYRKFSSLADFEAEIRGLQEAP